MKKFLFIVACLSIPCAAAFASNPLKKMTKAFASSSSEEETDFEPNPLLDLSHLNLQYMESSINDKIRKAEHRVEKYKKLLDKCQDAETMKEYSDKIQSSEDKLKTLREFQANLLQLKLKVELAG
jgi:hypothetical protein